MLLKPLVIIIAWLTIMYLCGKIKNDKFRALLLKRL
jgi:preprotein translocase subunit Sec63